MRRILPIAGCMAAGLALVVLLLQAFVAGRPLAPVDAEGVLPLLAYPTDSAGDQLDPRAAVAEIAQLRRAQGSVVAGTLLDSAEGFDEFNIALAQYTGEQYTGQQAGEVSSPQSELVKLLRGAARKYDDYAQGLEETEQYLRADELRRLADETRKLARALLQGTATAEIPEASEFEFTCERQ